MCLLWTRSRGSFALGSPHTPLPACRAHLPSPRTRSQRATLYPRTNKVVQPCERLCQNTHTRHEEGKGRKGRMRGVESPSPHCLHACDFTTSPHLYQGSDRIGYGESQSHGHPH